MTFRSKVDNWFYLVVAVNIIVFVAAYFEVPPGSEQTTVIISGILVTGFILWLMLTTVYVVDEEFLTAKAGPFRWRVALKDITKVEPSRSPLSAPALSLDRLRIDHGVGRVLLVSPADKEGFLKAIGQ